ncbi:MAG: hypothetical protein HY791_31015 [Deltaproteobacteria bacterium]|nr:hypothetical protein [Deltaproteobacteria bacterium]
MVKALRLTWVVAAACTSGTGAEWPEEAREERFKSALVVSISDHNEAFALGAPLGEAGLSARFDDSDELWFFGFERSLESLGYSPGRLETEGGREVPRTTLERRWSSTKLAWESVSRSPSLGSVRIPAALDGDCSPGAAEFEGFRFPSDSEIPSVAVAIGGGLGLAVTASHSAYLMRAGPLANFELVEIAWPPSSARSATVTAGTVRDRTLWLGTGGGGLFTVSLENVFALEAVEVVRPELGVDRSRLEQLAILSIALPSADEPLLATNGAGAVLELHGSNWRQISPESGSGGTDLSAVVRLDDGDALVTRMLARGAGKLHRVDHRTSELVEETGVGSRLVTAILDTPEGAIVAAAEPAGSLKTESMLLRRQGNRYVRIDSVPHIVMWMLPWAGGVLIDSVNWLERESLPGAFRSAAMDSPLCPEVSTGRVPRIGVRLDDATVFSLAVLGEQLWVRLK